MRELGLDRQAKGLDVPMAVNDEASPEQVPELARGETRRFRRIAALMNYVAQDWPDTQVVVSHLRGDMSRPTQRSWAMFKIMGRYSKKHQRLRFEYGEQDSKEGQELRVYSAAFGPGAGIRKSRSGGMILMSGGLIRSWSNRQGSVALSSDEAEYYVVVKACAEALGAQALVRDLGWDLMVKLHADGSARK